MTQSTKVSCVFCCFPFCGPKCYFILLIKTRCCSLVGKVRGDFKEIVHTIATVQTIDVSMHGKHKLNSIRVSVQIDALLGFP